MGGSPQRIPQGFPGQRMIVLPGPVVYRALRDQLPIALIPTDVGYFPAARSHYFERPGGCSQLILILCVRGRGSVTVARRRYDVSPGRLVVILPTEPHSYGADDESPWTIYWCHAGGQVADRLGAAVRQHTTSPVIEVVNQPHLISLFTEITDELSAGYGFQHLLAASLTLAHLLGQAWLSAQSQAIHADAFVRVRQLIRSMRERPNETISVSKLARMANLSNSHFSAIFRRITGFSVLDYFTRARVQRGCELLDSKSYSVKEVAQELGYTDSLYFSRVFRRIQGMSPTEYRNAVKG